MVFVESAVNTIPIIPARRTESREQLRTLSLREMVVVFGHASLKAEYSTLPEGELKEDYFALLPFQKGELGYYLDHIWRGLEEAHTSRNALLVFSGGLNRPASIRGDGSGNSEAYTYSLIARKLALERGRPEYLEVLNKRTVLEELSTNTFENCLYSLLTYLEAARTRPEIFGSGVPEFVQCVGWGDKEQRTYDHFEAIRYPRSQVRYAPVGFYPGNREWHLERERQTRELFQSNRYGVNAEFEKLREQRNGDHGHSQFARRLSDMAGFIDFISKQENGNLPYNGSLPWDHFRRAV